MCALAAVDPAAAHSTPLRDRPRRIATVRAVLALVWAAALVLAVGDDVPSTGSDVPVAAAALLASYPLIDVLASLAAATHAGPSGRVLRINAAISALAVVVIGVTAFGADAGATLAAFGAWALLSGAIQFGVALRRRHTVGHQVPMLISGGLSTLAGLSFLASAGGDAAHLANLAGYMALGAVLFLVSAWGTRQPAR